MGASVLMKLDCCKVLYFGIAEARLNKLQTVQNSAVHLIIKCMNQQDLLTSELLRKFNWQVMKKRIAFKILLTLH